MGVNTLGAILRFERFLNTNVNAQREDQYMSIEESSRLRATNRVKDEQAMDGALRGAKLLGTITYDLEKGETRYSPK